jgi:hypothetical protein
VINIQRDDSAEPNLILDKSVGIAPSVKQFNAKIERDMY